MLGHPLAGIFMWKALLLNFKDTYIHTCAHILGYRGKITFRDAQSSAFIFLGIGSPIK